MRPLLCPGNQGSLDSLLGLPQHPWPPVGPILTGLGPLLRLRVSPRVGRTGTSDSRAQCVAWHRAGRRECGCFCLTPPQHLYRTGSPSLAPRPKSLVFGYPVVIVISLKSWKVTYIGRDGSSAEKCSWVGYLLGEEEWDRVRVSV